MPSAHGALCCILWPAAPSPPADIALIFSHVFRLCTVYIQDYLCLGFALPPECDWGQELAWSPTMSKPAATKPLASTGAKGLGRHAAGAQP